MNKEKIIDFMVTYGWAILVVLIAFGMLIHFGIFSDFTENKEQIIKTKHLSVYAHCEDEVICYWHSGGYSGGMDCFRDNDLITKYCGRTK